MTKGLYLCSGDLNEKSEDPKFSTTLKVGENKMLHLKKQECKTFHRGAIFYESVAICS